MFWALVLVGSVIWGLSRLGRTTYTTYFCEVHQGAFVRRGTAKKATCYDCTALVKAFDEDATLR